MSSPPLSSQVLPPITPNSHGQQGQIGRTAEAVEARARHRGGGNGAAQQEQEEAGTFHYIVRIIEFH